MASDYRIFFLFVTLLISHTAQGLIIPKQQSQVTTHAKVAATPSQIRPAFNQKQEDTQPLSISRTITASYVHQTPDRAPSNFHVSTASQAPTFDSEDPSDSGANLPTSAINSGPGSIPSQVPGGDDAPDPVPTGTLNPAEASGSIGVSDASATPVTAGNSLPSSAPTQSPDDSDTDPIPLDSSSGGSISSPSPTQIPGGIGGNSTVSPSGDDPTDDSTSLESAPSQTAAAGSSAPSSVPSQSPVDGAPSPVDTSSPGPAPGSNTNLPVLGQDNGLVATGTPCTEFPEGQWNCVCGNSFQRCASRQWSAVQLVAAGTKCLPGISPQIQITVLGAAGYGPQRPGCATSQSGSSIAVPPVQPQPQPSNASPASSQPTESSDIQQPATPTGESDPSQETDPATDPSSVPSSPVDTDSPEPTQVPVTDGASGAMPTGSDSDGDFTDGLAPTGTATSQAGSFPTGGADPTLSSDPSEETDFSSDSGAYSTGSPSGSIPTDTQSSSGATSTDEPDDSAPSQIPSPLPTSNPSSDPDTDSDPTDPSTDSSVLPGNLTGATNATPTGPSAASPTQTSSNPDAENPDDGSDDPIATADSPTATPTSDDAGPTPNMNPGSDSGSTPTQTPSPDDSDPAPTGTLVLSESFPTETTPPSSTPTGMTNSTSPGNDPNDNPDSLDGSDDTDPAETPAPASVIQVGPQTTIGKVVLPTSAGNAPLDKRAAGAAASSSVPYVSSAFMGCLILSVFAFARL